MPSYAQDITELAKHVSVLDFAEAQPIIQKDEEATWIGIVCQGELEAVVNGNVVATMGPGTLVGELSYFSETDEGRKRQADVRGSSRGYIAFMQTSNLIELMEDAPQCGMKLVRALGSSSVSQLSHNVRLHKAIAWEEGAPSDEVKGMIAGWQSDCLGSEENGLESRDVERLVASVRHMRFKAGDALVDRFGLPRYICFVLSGSVVLKTNGQIVGQKNAGEWLCDLEYFDPGILPYDVVAEEDGVLAGISQAELEEMATEHPMLCLALITELRI